MLFRARFLTNSDTVFQAVELFVVQRFWSKSEKTFFNHKSDQKSNFWSFYVFWHVVNPFFSLSKIFAVRDPSV